MLAGLSAARFVTAAGGCLSIRGAHGEGTTVALYLPHVGTREVATRHPPPIVDPASAE